MTRGDDADGLRAAVAAALEAVNADTLARLRANLEAAPTTGRRVSATGALAKSLAGAVAAAGPALTATITAAAHWRHADRGRGPGGMPPVDAIAAWLRAKPVPVRGDVRAAAWAVARKIARDGTARPPSRFAAAALDGEPQRLDAELGKTLARWTIIYTSNIQL